MGIDKIFSLVDVAGSIEKFKAYRGAVERALPKSMEPGRYWTIYVQLMQKFMEDQKVSDKQSIFPCMFNAAKLALNPDPVMGQIYFIPYKGVLTYQIGYKGLIELAYRSGRVANIRAGLVYEKDKWTFNETETGQHYNFEPFLMAKNFADRGKRLFGYSIITDKQDHNFIHVMPGYHIDDIKKLVLARMKGSSTPWENSLFEPEMERKTVTRQHLKYEQLSSEIAAVTEHEEANERGEIKQENHTELAGIIDGMMDAAKTNQELDAQAAAESEKKAVA